VSLPSVALDINAPYPDLEAWPYDRMLGDVVAERIPGFPALLLSRRRR
jgi:hypothetical protein